MTNRPPFRRYLVVVIAVVLALFRCARWNERSNSTPVVDVTLPLLPIPDPNRTNRLANGESGRVPGFAELPSEGVSDEDLLNVFDVYEDAYLANDYETVYELLTARCKARYAPDDVKRSISTRWTLLWSFDGLNSWELETGEPTVERVGDEATLTYERFAPSGEALPEPEVVRLMIEDGRWLVSSCAFG